MENESLIQINPNIQTDVEIYWQDEVVLDLDMQLFYIKSGQNEVQKYVEDTVKPDIKHYTDDYAKPIVEATVNQIARPQIDNYIETVVLNKIEDFAEEQMSDYASRSESAAAQAETISQNVEELAENVRQTTQQAAAEAENAQNSSQLAQSIKSDCEHIKADCNIIKASLAGIYKWCGSVVSYDDLPTENVMVGDVYNVLATDMNYAWTESGWDQLGSSLYNIGYGLTLSDNTVAVNQDLVAMLSKFQVVSALPSSPVDGVFYFVKEG